MAAGRITYALTLALLGVILFLSGSPMVLVCLAVLVLVGISLWGLLRRDGKNVTLSCEVSPGARVGVSREMPIHVRSCRRILAAKTLLAELEITNAMTGEVRHRQLVMPLRRRESGYALSVTPENCGELTVVCTRAWLRDHLDLYNRKTAPFAPAKVMVYPQNVRLDVHLDPNSTGSPKEGGPMQNRRGNDPSEVFDLREYAPGDDIRSIHWKLSVKTDTLVLRQSGAPTYYDLALLVDIGLTQNGESTDTQERSAAIAYGAAAMRDLVRQGVRSCLAVPTAEGMVLMPVSSREEYQDALSRWLRLRLPQRAGDAMKLFRSEHLDDRFSRVLMLNAGKLTRQQDISATRSNVTVLSAVAGAAENAAAMGAARFVELPAPPDRNTRSRVSC